MRFADVVVAAGTRQAPRCFHPGQMATTLGFHIILACLGIALPTFVLLAEFIGLRRSNEVALVLAPRWSQAMGVLVAVGAVTGTVLSFEMGLLRSGLMRQYGAVLGFPFGPTVAAVLVSTVGLGWCFVVNAASFGFVTASLLSLDTRRLHPGPARAAPPRAAARRPALRRARAADRPASFAARSRVRACSSR